MKSLPSNLVAPVLLTAAVLTLMACGGKPPEGSLVVPRGATISVRTTEPVIAGAEPGALFRAELDSPLSTGSAIFAPAGARLEGVVEPSGAGGGAVELHLTRLHLDDSSSVGLETLPMSRSAASVAVSNVAIEATSGLQDKIRYLAEIEDAGNEDAADSDAGAIVPRGSQLVFTLSKDLVLLPNS